jgi:drug/metabolite transporter (DMT)-like permease
VWYYLLNFMDVSHQTIWGYLIPIFGILFSWLMVGDLLTASQMIATAIIISGVAISQIVRRPGSAGGAAPEAGANGKGGQKNGEDGPRGDD